MDAVEQARQMVAAGAIEVRYGREYDASIVRRLLDRIDSLEAFVQRFIDLGYEFGDPTVLVDLHDSAVQLLPDRNAEDA